MAHDDLLGQQVAYYRARASEYDDWWFRRGRYDRGPRANARWLRDIAAVEQAVAEFAPCGDVVELAAGTGNWTRWLSPVSRSVLAVDASEEVLAVNRAQTRAGNVSYLQADLFGWQPERSFDEAFFGFWLSHVPPERFNAFWDLVERLVAPAGRFFLVDSLYTEQSTAADHDLRGRSATSVTRRLDDGREFQIVKVFWDPSELQERLTRRGWRALIRTTEDFFLYGHGQR